MRVHNSALFLLSGLLCLSPAWAVETCSSVATLENSVSALSTSIDSSFALTSKLSDDIGLMADRIGVMADRIVETETLLANTLVTLTGNSTSPAPTVLLTSPMDGATVPANTAPAITLSPAANRYLLFASNSPLFPASDTVSLLIDTSNTTLSTAWSLIAGTVAKNGDIFLAVRSLDANDQQSDLSNNIKLIIQ